MINQKHVEASINPNRAKSNGRPPLQRGRFFSGVLFDFKKDPLRLMTRTHLQLGELVQYRVPLMPYRIYGVADPDLVKRVLLEDEKNFTKHGQLVKNLRLAVGDGLFTMIGGKWDRVRERQNPSFSRKKIGDYESVFATSVARMLSRWPQKDAEALDVSREMSMVTLDIALNILFSSSFAEDPAEIFSAFEEAQKYSHYLNGAAIPLPRWIQTKRNRDFSKAEAVLHRMVRKLIENRNLDKNNHEDLFQSILDARDPQTGNKISYLEIYGEIINTLFAGHDTSASNLAFALKHLIENPSCLKRLESEIATILKGQVPTIADLDRMEYTRCVLNEILRMYPAVWGQPRTNLIDIEHKGFNIPKGSILILSNWCVHRNPAYWDEPEKFDPDRFSTENRIGRHRFAFFPFGAGPRTCIGYHVALYETAFVLAMVVQQYTLLRVCNESRVQAKISLRPDPNIIIEVQKRAALLGVE